MVTTIGFLIFFVIEIGLIGFSYLFNHEKNSRYLNFYNIVVSGIFIVFITFLSFRLGFALENINFLKGFLPNISYLIISIIAIIIFYLIKIANRTFFKNRINPEKHFPGYMIENNKYYLDKHSVLIGKFLKVALGISTIVIAFCFSFLLSFVPKIYKALQDGFSLEKLDYKIFPTLVFVPLFILFFSEIVAYLDGEILEDVENNNLETAKNITENEAKNEKEFLPLYNNYKKIWEKNILADYKSQIKKEELSEEELAKNEKETKDLEKVKIDKIINSDEKLKKDLEEIKFQLLKNNCELNSEMINILKDLLNKKDMIISNSNYEELAPILFSYLENGIIKGKKILVLVENKLYNNLNSREILKTWFDSWFKKLYKKNIRKIVEFSEWKKKKEEWDILLTTQNELIKSREEFIEEIQNSQEEIKDIIILVINENSEKIAENILTLSILTNILNTFFKVDKKRNDDGAQYIILSDATSNLNESINKSLGISAESRNMQDKEPCNVYSIIWRTDVKNKYYEDIMDTVPRNEIGISNILSYLPWEQKYNKAEFIGQEDFPYERYNTNVENYKDLLKERPISKENIVGDYRSFVNNNFISSIIKKEKYKLLYIYDKNQNFPLLLKKYASLGEKEVFLNIITPAYLLRDYFVDNIEYFIKSPIYGYTPKIESDKFKIASYLKEILTNEKLEISEEDIKIELLSIKEKIGNIEKELVDLFEEIYSVDILKTGYLTVTNKQEYNMENKKFEERKIFKMSAAINDIGYFTWFENFDVVDTGKKTYRLIPFEHIYQNYLPEQVHYFNGNSFKIDKIDTINKKINISPVENEKFAIYRNKDEINIIDDISNKEIISKNSSELYSIIKEVQNIECEIKTLGYFKFIDNISMANQAYSYKELENSETYTREYKKNKLLTLTIEKKNGIITNLDKIALTFTVILNEMFKTLFAGNSEYLKVFPMVNEDLFEEKIDEFSKTGYVVPNILSQILPAKVTIEKSKYGDIFGKTANNKLSIYLIEDSYKDMGLIQAVQDNFENILRLVQDYLNWLNEDSKNQTKYEWNKNKISTEEKYSFLKYGKEDISEYLSLDETSKFLNNILESNEDTNARRKFYSTNITNINIETEDEFDKEYEYLRNKVNERKK